MNNCLVKQRLFLHELLCKPFLDKGFKGSLVTVFFRPIRPYLCRSFLNMVIAVNTKALLPGKTEGYGYFIEEIFFRVAALHPEHQFYFLFDRAYTLPATASTNIKAVVVTPQARHPLLWQIWYNWRIPAVLKKINAHVFVSPDGFCSLRTTVPQCLVVHDLAFLHYPDFLVGSHLRYYKKNTGRFLAKAKQVVTVSAFSKADIIEKYKTPADKIAVVYNAVHPLFQPLALQQREAIKEKYTEGCEYFIFTGTIHPRKNLINLLRAFSQFKKKQSSNMKLVICGRMAWKTEEFTTLLGTFKFRRDVILTGYIPKEELALLVGAAYAMVYPSYFEGFGVPPLEALQCAVPAIVSRNSALPEVGGDAYLYMDPTSVDDLAQKMILLYKDEALRNKLISNGEQRLKLFSWEESAHQMWNCIEAAAQAE